MAVSSIWYKAKVNITAARLYVAETWLKEGDH
jgi:hypothetical protein